MMMDMKFSPDWLRRVAKEEEDVRFSVGGWTSGIIRPGAGETTNVTKTFCYIHSRPQIYFHNRSKMGVQLSHSYIGKARYSIRSEEKRGPTPTNRHPE
jgi:hypothetical protein